MSFTPEEIEEVTRVLKVSRDVYDYNIDRQEITDDQLMEALRKHFVEEASACLVVESGPDERVGAHLVAAFGMKMQFLRPSLVYEFNDRTKVELVSTEKGQNIMDIGTMLKTGDWPQDGSEPPKRIINVRRLA